MQYYKSHYIMDRGVLQVEVLYQSSSLATAEYVFFHGLVRYEIDMYHLIYSSTERKQSREKDTPELGLPLLDQQENKNGKHP